MYRKGNATLIILIALGGCFLAKAVILLKEGKLTDAAVILLVMGAIVAEQISSRYSSNTTVIRLLKTIKVAGVVGAFAVLVVSGLRST